MDDKQAKKTGPLSAIKGDLGSALASAQEIASGASTKAKALIEPVIIRFLQPVLQWLQCRWRVIRPARVGLILSIAISLFLIGNDQAEDILHVIAENRWWQGSNWALLFGLLVYASTAWYFSRATLYVFYDSFTPRVSDRQFEWLRKVTARVVGALPFFAVTYSFFGISGAHAIFYFVAGALFVLALALRRRYILPRLYPTSEDGKVYIGLHRNQGLTDRTRPAVVGISVLALALFLGVLAAPVVFPTLTGTLGVLFLGAAGLVVMFTLLTYWTDYYDLPSLVFLLILTAVVAGLYNDNHGVRTLEEDLAPGDRMALAEHFEKWMGARLTAEVSKGMKYPVFVVAAEGGGIRAAFWTAAVLTELQKSYPDFPCHIFAISGVSGGSLGGSAFVADLANAFRAGKFRCTESQEASREQSAGPLTNQPIDSTSAAFLGEDFLAPTVGGLLFPDLVSRVNIFCPWLFCFPDRASYLEWAWEYNWTKHNEDAPLQFSADFLDLWEAGGELQIPSLVLNGTWVENGKRTLTSNLKPRAAKLPDVDDLLANFDKRIPLSTAVHMSARFTYISPAGTVNTKPKGTKRIVDGGYFENSGALSARQILKLLQDTCTSSQALSSADCKGSVRFYGIIISNNPQSPHAVQGARLAQMPAASQQDSSKQEAHAIPADSPPEKAKKSLWSRVMSETLSPAIALFNTRTARGSLAEAELVAAIGEPRSLRFQLSDPPGRGKEIPLGWVLAKKTQEEILRQARARVDDYEGKLLATDLRRVSYNSGKGGAAPPEKPRPGEGSLGE